MFRVKKEQTETTYRLIDEYNHEYTVIISEDQEGNLIWDILDSDGNSVENEMLVESIVHVIEALRDEENLKGHEFNPN